MEIDLEALRGNVRLCSDLAGAGCGIMAVVKADAYGHGLNTVVDALKDEVSWFGVANVEEAIAVRDATEGMDLSILILSPLSPGERAVAVNSGFAVPVSCEDEISSYEKHAAKCGKEARLHIALDTGMGRIGIQPEDLPTMIGHLRDATNCSLEGIWSHFPSADEDSKFTLSQISEFKKLVKDLSSCHIHLANSAGLLAFHKELSFTTLARTGLAIYGVSPLGERGAALCPALTWKTRVTLVREIAKGSSVSYGRTFTSDGPMTSATLAVGYGDGYPRSLSNRDTEVLIAGTRCALLGRVTMDQIVVDVSHLQGKVLPGDEVVLIGRQGSQYIGATELAEKAGTIAWEVFTGITRRVERCYQNLHKSLS